MRTDDKIRNLAGWYSDRMTTDKRSNGDTFWKFKDLPKADEERCRELAFAAHNGGDMLPDDWRYGFLREALCAIEEADDVDNATIEADIYTSELTEWLGSRADRAGYCDDAQRDGMLSEDASMFDRLTAGQYMEKREVLDAVLSHLRDEADASDYAEETEEANA